MSGFKEILIFSDKYFFFDIIPIYGYSVNKNGEIFAKNRTKILLFNTKSDAFCRALTELDEDGKKALVSVAYEICLKKHKRIAKMHLL